MKSNLIFVCWAAAFLALCGCRPEAPQEDPSRPYRDQGWIDGVRYFSIGDPADIDPANTLPGLCLMGGGPDNDEALRWMIQRGRGGDVVVIRASGGDGYNDYFFCDLGGVHSVTTLIIDSAEGARSSVVAERIKKAEILFIAGGDQTRYDELWRGSAVLEAVNHLLGSQQIPVGGTSAGMAVLTGLCYLPRHDGVTSAQALSDPYHQNMESIENSMLHADILSDILGDTHFSERLRLGRSLAFLARLIADQRTIHPAVRALACDEGTAVCIDENGQARIFGRYPARADHAFFLKALSAPVVCIAGHPLHWPWGVRVVRLPGTPDGQYGFDLMRWDSPDGLETIIGVEFGQIVGDVQTPD